MQINGETTVDLKSSIIQSRYWLSNLFSGKRPDWKTAGNC